MKKINLGPGPSFIPENLNESLISSLFDNGERGFSILHQSHRSKEFEDFLNNFRDDIRQFLEVPKNYEVLIMQGGATMLFALLAQNFRFDKRPASYLISGFWSKLAAKNASNSCSVEVSRTNVRRRASASRKSRHPSKCGI